MGSFVRAVLLGSLLFSLVDCSGDHGFLGTDYNPKGDLRFTNPTTGALILTSATQPYLDTQSGFSVGISETNFSGPYTVTMTSWTNGFNEPCFEPQSVDTTDATNVILFSAINANSGTTAQTNPCFFDGHDIEAASFNDNKGHSATFYFELAAGGGAQSSKRR